MEQNLIFPLFLIFIGAAVLSTLALMMRQSMLIAYIILGFLIGPAGLKLVTNINIVHEVGDVGIIFLLFLLGLHLPPQKLFQMLQKVSWVTLISSFIFGLIGFGIAWLSHFDLIDCVVIGAAMIFSSTIIGIKLLPTTILHHQHTGEVMISVLLLQDLLAIIVLLLMNGAILTTSVSKMTTSVWGYEFFITLIGLPFILILGYLFERYVLLKLVSRFNRIKEYLFLLAIAWCLGMSQLASMIGLSPEIGAFIAGVSLANNPISVYIAESLKPVRDFFLVMFFFAVGAMFDFAYIPKILVPVLALGIILLIVKPWVFRFLLQKVGETKQVAWEVGVRLGQISEFSLIIAYLALDKHLTSSAAAYLIEATAILTFIVSSYWVVLRYPTPIAVSDWLRRD